jgi:hypothetical protein
MIDPIPPGASTQDKPADPDAARVEGAAPDVLEARAAVDPAGEPAGEGKAAAEAPAAPVGEARGEALAEAKPEAAAEPVAEAKAEAPAEPVAEAKPEAAAEPVAEAKTEAAAEPVAEATAAVAAEPVGEAQTEVPADAKPTTEAPAAEAPAEAAAPEPEPAAPAPEPEPAAPPPVVTGIEPAAVPVKGGTVVTILGSGFAEGCSMLIDGVPMPGARVHAGRLEVVVSRHAAGTVNVAVKNPDGQLGPLPAALRYAEPPVVGSVSPDRGLTTGGYELTIVGRHFVDGCAVLIAGEPAPGVVFESDTELTLRAPAHHPETVDVAVVNPDGLGHRAPLAFVYEQAPPRIASVSPEAGPNAGGTTLFVRGTDFDRECHVYVCGIKAEITWSSREEVRAVTPAVARDGLVDVRLVNTDDQASTLAKAFRYDAPLPPPVLVAVSPASGSQVGGTKLSVLGEDFAEGVVVRVGGAVAEAKFLTRKQLEVVTPAYAGAGAVDVLVENPDGVTATLEGVFTYEARPSPTITGVTPPNGPGVGGTKVVIEGTHFTRDAQVYVGREYPKDQQIKSATEIHIVTAPRKMPGVVDVEVAVPGLPRAVMKNAFRYDAVPAPIITSVSPNAGGVGGGTEMTVAGKNFRKDTIVLVDGKPPKVVKFIDAATLELKTPPGDAGKMVDVAVRNPDGKEAVQKRAFLYDPRYR